MENFETKLLAVKKPWTILGGIFDKEEVETKIKELEQTCLSENFWKDNKLVKKIVKQKNFLRIFCIFMKNLLKI